MYNGQLVKDLIASSGLTQKDICDRAGIVQSTLNKMTVDGANPTARNLEMVANAIGCRIDDFFDRDHTESIGHNVNGNGNMVSGDIKINSYLQEINHYKSLLKEKDNRIKDKDEIIELLRQQLACKM
ncbi:MAG: helix-turn-helix domain-containing protein [Parabacteroides sp.]